MYGGLPNSYAHQRTAGRIQIYLATTILKRNVNFEFMLTLSGSVTKYAGTKIKRVFVCKVGPMWPCIFTNKLQY